MIRLLRNIVVRNWALKLFALALAFILWLTLIPEEKTFSDKTFVVPLDLRNLPADYEFAERTLPTIDVTVSAPNRLLSQMTSQDIQAALNLSRARTDQEDYPLNPDMITIPPGARVVRVFPNIIKLKIERSKQVLMDIQGTFVGRVKPGFDIAKIEILPPQVNVRGPESKFKAKERVRTSPIDVTGLDRPATFDVDLILPRPELRFVDGQTRATVLVTVVKK